jgi:hypothetical protein
MRKKHSRSFAFIRVIRGLFESLRPPPKTIPIQLSTQAGLGLNPPVPTYEGMTFVLTRYVAIYDIHGVYKKYIDR